MWMFYTIHFWMILNILSHPKMNDLYNPFLVKLDARCLCTIHFRVLLNVLLGQPESTKNWMLCAINFWIYWTWFGYTEHGFKKSTKGYFEHHFDHILFPPFLSLSLPLSLPSPPHQQFAPNHPHPITRLPQARLEALSHPPPLTDWWWNRWQTNHSERREASEVQLLLRCVDYSVAYFNYITTFEMLYL